MNTTDRWLRFARLALQIGREVLPTYAHKYSPRRFTLPQLAACVLLKEYRQADWRSIEELLAVSPPLRKCLGLQRVHDYSTLWRFARRWLTADRLSALLAELVRRISPAPVAVAH